MNEVEAVFVERPPRCPGVPGIEGESTTKTEIEWLRVGCEFDDSVSRLAYQRITCDDHGVRKQRTDPVGDVVSPRELAAVMRIIVNVMSWAEEDLQ